MVMDSCPPNIFYTELYYRCEKMCRNKLIFQYLQSNPNPTRWMKSSVASNIRPCSPVKLAQHLFGDFVLGLLLIPEYGGYMLLRNVGSFSTYKTKVKEIN
jgi:hypothetical protein